MTPRVKQANPCHAPYGKTPAQGQAITSRAPFAAKVKTITHNYINIAQDENVYNFKQNDFYPFLFVTLFDGTSPYPKSQIPERYGSIQFVNNNDEVITPKKVN